MGSKLYRSHKALSSLQLQKNDASPRTKFLSENKTLRGALSVSSRLLAGYKKNALRTLRLWPSALTERSE
jgi:hypothetical protein